MRKFYFLYVAFVSVEALVIALFFGAWFLFGEPLQHFISRIEISGDLVKYLMFVPMSLAAWIVVEARLLLHEDRAHARVLLAWPDYWKFKTHFWVAILYTAVFAFSSLIPWATKDGISSSGGFLVFAACTIGTASIARDVLAARVRVREVVAQLEAT